jgi:hypothetical protein
MGWGLAAAWLAVVGTLVLTFGTGAQAWANLAEFESLKEIVSKEVSDAIKQILPRMFADGVIFPGATSPFRALHMLARLLRLFIAGCSIQWATVVIPVRLRQLREEGGPQAAEMGRYLRAAAAWSVLMVGSALALVSSAVQLALAYQ